MSFYYGRYTKYRELCPHCGEQFRTVLDPAALRLGPGSGTCRRCGQAFSTGSLEWPEMDKKQRRAFLLGGLPWFVAFFAAFAGLFVYLAVRDPKSSATAMKFAAGILAVGASLLALFYITCLVQITLSKKRYKLKASQ